MAIRDPSSSNNDNSIRPPSPAATATSSSSTSYESKLKELVVSSANKDSNNSSSPSVSKEDETTNSTAGSSTTNTTIEDSHLPGADNNPAALEVKVVTTTQVSSESKKNDSPANNSNGGAAAGVPTGRSRSNSKGNAGNNNNARRAGQNNNNNNNKGGRGNNNNQGNINGRQNNNNNNNFSRNGSGASGVNNARRRANNGGEKAICTFFVRGMCNRGASCAYRHDPAHAPSQNNNANNNNSTGSTPSSNNDVRRTNSSFGNNNSYQPKMKRTGSGNDGGGAVSTTTPFVPGAKRTFDPHKARAIQLAKGAQDHEDRSRFASTVKIIPSGGEEDKKEEEEVVAVQDNDPPFFSIDVECIATGYGSCAKGINDGCGNERGSEEDVPSTQYNDRSHRYPGRVAMVDSKGNVLADIVIRPPHDGKGVVSYLTPLTGLTAEMCLGDDAVSLQEAVKTIKGLLPKNGVLVGQAIDHDVEWLGLTPGKDFERMLDISEIFRQRMPSVLAQAADVLKAKETATEEEKTSSSSSSEDLSSDEHLGFATRYRHFSLRHVCLNLLGTDIQSGVHDPIVDAKYSLMLFHKYRNSSVTQLRIVRDGLHRAPITPGFAQEKTPVIDGVCVSAAGYRYKFAARRIWRWYSLMKKTQSS